MALVIAPTGSTAQVVGGDEEACDAFFEDLWELCGEPGDPDYDLCEENAVIAWHNCMNLCYYEYGAPWPGCEGGVH
jgi:hypothetical protein